MAGEKLNMGSAENTSPKAAEPIATPEQAAASEPRQEQTGLAMLEPSDVVVSFDKINELMVEKRQNTCAEAEKAETPETPEAAVPGETPQPTNTEESKKLRRGRPPKAEKAATEKQNKKCCLLLHGQKAFRGEALLRLYRRRKCQVPMGLLHSVTEFLRPQSSSDAS
ncbi:MAG: hypothetical protein JTJ09_08300 [Enterococcus sp.]|nr:hypothetical protein [Enterococcus sp.]